VSYDLVAVTRLARQQIEVLAEHTPSLVIVLHGEPESDERTVLIAQAVQDDSRSQAGAEQIAPVPADPMP
jgi:hypothetical protein